MYGGGSLTRLEPKTKGLVKKGMTVEEYLEHQPEEEMADSKQISSILDSEAAIWYQVHWRLSEGLFLFWYIWLKNNTAMVERFVEGLEILNDTNSHFFSSKKDIHNFTFLILNF